MCVNSLAKEGERNTRATTRVIDVIISMKTIWNYEVSIYTR